MSEAKPQHSSPCLITIVKGDITQQTTDVIVNAANERLLGGGGVDGAIHRAAGPKLLEECEKINGCMTGFMRVTDAHDLSEQGVRKIFHAVGPQYGNHIPAVAAQYLRSCYRECLSAMDLYSRRLKSISFPSISTGIFKYPVEEAAQIALEAALRFSLWEREYTTCREIRFVLFSDEDLNVYTTEFAKLMDKFRNS